MPSYLKSKYHIDFTNDSEFSEKFEELERHIFKKPKYLKPNLGPEPLFSTEPNNAEQRVSPAALRSTLGVPARGMMSLSPIVDVLNEMNAVMYCQRCGIIAGTARTECIGLQTAHNFVKGRGFVYCLFCGQKVGKKIECTSMSAIHEFVTGEGSEFCSRCGVRVGNQTLCVGLRSGHNFVPMH
jgi:hypothetical protein